MQFLSSGSFAAEIVLLSDRSGSIMVWFNNGFDNSEGVILKNTTLRSKDCCMVRQASSGEGSARGRC